MAAQSSWIIRSVICGIAALAWASACHAASPELKKILPRGGQRGTEVETIFEGLRLGDTQEILIYQPGITVTKIEQPTEGPKGDKGQAGKQVKVTLKIAPDARLGEYCMRLRSATGISELRTFWVGPFPTVAEKEPNSDFKNPQPIGMNVTVAGVIENEDQDFFVVEAKKGQRISAEVEGIRLGGAMFDPYLAILDENRFELAACDDSALLRQDSVVSIIAPKDGKYIILLRDSAFGGSGDSHYRLHVGTFPRPLVVFPLGGQVGQDVSVTYLGDPTGPIKQTIKLPAKADPDFELYAEQNGQTPPSPNYFRVSDFPNVMEVEPNDTIKTATAYDGELPVAFNGIISQTSAGENKPDNDFFKFKAKKGQVIDVNVYARRLRSPLDSVLYVMDSKGSQIATNDDSGGPDSYLRVPIPADGEYYVRVRDHLRGAGEQYAYRVEVTLAKPSITLSIPQYTPNYSQERQAVAVPKGNKYATLVRLARADYGGAVTMESPQLPAGVKMTAENLEPGVDAVPVLFEAAPDAAISGKLVDLLAKAAAPGEVASGFKQIIEMVISNPNNTAYSYTDVNKMAVVVADEAPYTLQIIEPKAPLVQGGETKLKIVATRKKDFTGPIAVRMLFKPPGVECAANVEIPANQTEVFYPMNASDGAPAKKWKLVVVGSADLGGLVWVSSPFAGLEVAAPFVTAKITNADVEQGQTVKIGADLDVKTRWDGPAKVELVGLPGNTTATEKTITADDKHVEFAVTTGKNTPAAAHNGLFLRVTLKQNGEEVVHNIGRGGVLRVDAPLGVKPEKGATTKPAAKPAAKPEKPAK